MLRRWITPWLLALALLAGQMGALAHAASHLSKPDSGLPDHVCELCLAQASLGSAAASTSFFIATSDATYHWYLPASVNTPETRPPVARARAPPSII